MSERKAVTTTRAEGVFNSIPTGGTGGPWNMQVAEAAVMAGRCQTAPQRCVASPRQAIGSNRLSLQLQGPTQPGSQAEQASAQ
jgi:hypothetical protein